MAVLHDIIDNPTGRFTFDGWQFERTAVVTGVTGDGHEKLLNAMNTAGIPVLGTAHPSAPATYLREAIPTADDSSTVRIRLIYADPMNMSHRQLINTIEVGGTLSQVETEFDRFGTMMYTTYTYPVGHSHNAGEMIDQPSLVSLLIPEHTITKSRLEYGSPGPVAKDFVGTVNAAGWNLDPAAALGTWLCTGITGRSNDGGSSFVATYSFQYRGDTWKTEIRFKDPVCGVGPMDLIANVGYKTYEIYNIMNFNLLGLA